MQHKVVAGRSPNSGGEAKAQPCSTANMDMSYLQVTHEFYATPSLGQISPLPTEFLAPTGDLRLQQTLSTYKTIQ